jgi:hypothetical protein
MIHALTLLQQAADKATKERLLHTELAEAAAQKEQDYLQAIILLKEDEPNIRPPKDNT